MLSLWGLDGDRASDGGGRPDTTTRGVDAVLAHLAKLPPQESLTLAEQRAQYERAERAFPIPADVTVERVTAPVAPAEMARAYLAGADPKTPLASPRFADLSGLPPLLIHVGRDEVLLDDATGLAEGLKVAGVAARLEIVPRMVHVWHWFLPMLDEAQTAVDDIGAFVNAHVG